MTSASMYNESPRPDITSASGYDQSLMPVSTPHPLQRTGGGSGGIGIGNGIMSASGFDQSLLPASTPHVLHRTGGGVASTPHMSRENPMSASGFYDQSFVMVNNTQTPHGPLPTSTPYQVGAGGANSASG